MGRKSYQLRCDECFMRPEYCICEAAAACKAKIKCRTKLQLIFHYREVRKSTNTGRLAELCLPQTKTHIHGSLEPRPEFSIAEEEKKNTLLLYPSEDSVDVREIDPQPPHPYTLVVPDGNWRQASKIPKRIAALKDLRRVHIDHGGETQYFLRNETKDKGLATFEAIMRALQHFEGEATYQQLKVVFDLMVRRTLRSRKGMLSDP